MIASESETEVIMNGVWLLAVSLSFTFAGIGCLVSGRE